MNTEIRDSIGNLLLDTAQRPRVKSSVRSLLSNKLKIGARVMSQVRKNSGTAFRGFKYTPGSCSVR